LKNRETHTLLIFFKWLVRFPVGFHNDLLILIIQRKLDFIVFLSYLYSVCFPHFHCRQALWRLHACGHVALWGVSESVGRELLWTGCLSLSRPPSLFPDDFTQLWNCAHLPPSQLISFSPFLVHFCHLFLKPHANHPLGINELYITRP